ncbi:CS1 type fimbrial major subunit [Pseudomonas atagonensis]|uniref:CS1 type fimbrial major subunit n=1 Tax=Pseudomonas atagonensis TaxID=2609964 RepID=UPI00140AF977|nr:CS1 type fimbrial major subunit [Pseudomonas atagonensis]
MNRELTTRIFLSGWLLAADLAFAAREVQEFDVSVTIPTSAFHVLPADNGWIHLEQKLPWNMANSTLGSLRKYFDVKSESGAIEARLDSAAYLSNGIASDDIALQVSFNGKLLSVANAAEVVTANEAKQGQRVLLEIAPQPPGDGVYKPGKYYGNVNMMFNAVLPGSLNQ